VQKDEDEEDDDVPFALLLNGAPSDTDEDDEEDEEDEEDET
jgi:hypothetical protein